MRWRGQGAWLGQFTFALLPGVFACGRVGYDAACVDCDFDAGTGIRPAAICGDGIVGSIEDCDDRNDAEGDGCVRCTYEDQRAVLGDDCEDSGVLVWAALGEGARGAQMSGDTRNATLDDDSSCGGTGAPDQYARFVLAQTSSVEVVVRPTSASFDPVVSVRGPRDASCDGEEAGCTNDGGPGAQERLRLDAAPPGEYSVGVDGPTGASDANEAGSYELTVVASVR